MLESSASCPTPNYSHIVHSIVIKIVLFRQVQSETYYFDWKLVWHIFHNCSAEISACIGIIRVHEYTGPIFNKAGMRPSLFMGTTKVIEIVCKKHSPAIIGSLVLVCKDDGTFNAFYKGLKSTSLLKGRCGTLPTTLNLQEIAIFSMLCLCLSLLLSMWDTKCPPPSSPIAFPLSHINGGKESST